MTRIFAALAALLLAACVSTPQSQTGRLYHYLRTNHDGSLPEHVYVFRDAPDHVSVYKMVERCTNAAYVTGEFDLAAGHATRLIGGRLTREGTQDAFAFLTYDPAASALSARVTLPGQILEETEHVGHAPWRLFDFDLADFNALANGPPPRADFSFGFALVWTAGGDGGFLRDMGLAEARFAGAESHGGRAALRYDVTGAVSGPLWLDARHGHVLEARWEEPNHAEYENFRFVLQDVSDGGADAWRRLLASHWEGCA